MTQNNPSFYAYEFANDRDEVDVLASLEKKPPGEIVEPPFLSPAAEHCRSLPVVIRRALGTPKGGAVLFTSAYAREGAPGIAIRAAHSAARQLSGKVLYIHLSSGHSGFFRDIEDNIPVALNDYINDGGGDNLPFVTLAGSGLVCACFRGPGEFVRSADLKALMMAARRRFELLVLGGDNLLKGGASGVFSDLVDGTILVMEAEKTRAPVAMKLKQAVEEGGGKVIGAVLNRRRHHIPDWIYKTLYGGC